MRFKRHYQMTKGELNLTPLVDVIFLQLIYFMLTSSFIMQPGIKIKLPKATTTETIKKEEIFVSLSEEGIIFYKGQPITLKELEEIFRREKGKYKFACPYAQRVNRRVKCQRYFGSDLDKIGACLLKCLEVEKKEKCEISESSFVREMKIKYSR